MSRIDVRGELRIESRLPCWWRSLGRRWESFGYPIRNGFACRRVGWCQKLPLASGNQTCSSSAMKSADWSRIHINFLRLIAWTTTALPSPSALIALWSICRRSWQVFTCYGWFWLFTMSDLLCSSPGFSFIVRGFLFSPLNHYLACYPLKSSATMRLATTLLIATSSSNFTLYFAFPRSAE